MLVNGCPQCEVPAATQVQTGLQIAAQATSSRVPRVSRRTRDALAGGFDAASMSRSRVGCATSSSASGPGTGAARSFATLRLDGLRACLSGDTCAIAGRPARGWLSVGRRAKPANAALAALAAVIGAAAVGAAAVGVGRAGVAHQRAAVFHAAVRSAKCPPLLSLLDERLMNIYKLLVQLCPRSVE